MDCTWHGAPEYWKCKFVIGFMIIIQHKIAVIATSVQLMCQHAINTDVGIFAAAKLDLAIAGLLQTAEECGEGDALRGLLRAARSLKDHCGAKAVLKGCSLKACACPAGLLQTSD